jgi:hypothetical protein
MRIALMIFLGALMAPFSANACSCGAVGIEAAAAYASYVMIARATFEAGDDDRGRFHLDVLAVWRGDIPDTLAVSPPSSNCDVSWKSGRTYLIYARTIRDGIVMTSPCMGTRPVEEAVVDRYLLGTPVVCRDDRFESIQLDDLLTVVSQPGPRALRVADDFYSVRFEAPRLLPRLRRIALGFEPGNRVAALRALGAMREHAGAISSDLRWAFSDAPDSLRVEALNCYVSVGNDAWEDVSEVLLRHIDDESAAVRYAAISLLTMRVWIPRTEEWAVSRVLHRRLRDEDPGVRAIAIDRMVWVDRGNETARRIRMIGRSDPAGNVRASADDYLRRRNEMSERALPGRILYERGFRVNGRIGGGRR